MKSLKVFLLSILFILFFTISAFAAELTTKEIKEIDFKLAEDTEIDPYAIIKFPNYTSTDNIKITVDDSQIGNYEFFYQTIDLTQAQYEAINNARNKYNNDIAALQEQLKNEEAELKAEEARAKELYEEYKAEYEKDPASEETKAAKKKYDDAYAAYTTHVDNYNAYLQEQITILDKNLKDLRALYPKYDDSKWIAAPDNIAKYTKNVTQDTHFALWIKLQTSTDSYYAVADFSVKANNPSDTNTITNQTPTNNTVDIKPDVNDDTKSPSTLPAAGNSLVIFTVIAIISIISGYSYIRYNTIDK